MQRVLAAARRSAGMGSITPALALIAGGVASAGLAGSITASVGWLIGDKGRLLITGAAAIAVTLVSLRRERPYQLRRQTWFGWTRLGGLRSAALTGLELGPGFLTRIGFWMWYAIPVGVLVTCSPVGGAVVWSGYAAMRLAVSAIPQTSAARDRAIRANPGIEIVLNVVHVIPLSIMAALTIGTLLA